MRSQAGPDKAEDGRAGFTLLELLCVLAIVGLIAAIALPLMPSGTSRAQVEGYALRVAALLEADHTAAIRERQRRVTVVDVQDRTVRSGLTGARVTFPADVTLHADLAESCQGTRAEGTIVHLPSGMSCGGSIEVSRNGVGWRVQVNWLTGGIQVAPAR